ncbi:MAG: alanine racemase [Psychroflexus salarius]
MPVKETRLIINLSDLAFNYAVIKEKLKPETKIMGVVKAFAYGTDSVVVAQKLVDLGVDYLAVAYIEEGVRLRQSGITIPILVFYPQVEELKQLLTYNLTPSIYNFRYLKKINATLKKEGIEDFQIHIKINTGLNRLGFDLNELEAIYNEINQSKRIKLVGLFSHLAASGNAKEAKFTQSQIEKFEFAKRFFQSKFDQKLIAHLCNSSGIFNFPEAEYDMVRAGIALYGYGNNTEEHEQLQPISSLKTVITQLRSIQVGESVGYERLFKASRKTKVATLPLGYVDGIARQFGNLKAEVLINGKTAPIIGNVCMDTMMIDVTDIECKEGDHVTIFGKEHSALKFDKLQQSIPYEIITRISQRVTRVIES